MQRSSSSDEALVNCPSESTWVCASERSHIISHAATMQACSQGTAQGHDHVDVDRDTERDLVARGRVSCGHVDGHALAG